MNKTLLILSVFLATQSVAMEKPIDPENGGTLLRIQYTPEWHEHLEAGIRLEWQQSLQAHFNDLPLVGEVLWSKDRTGYKKMFDHILDCFTNPAHNKEPYFYKLTKDNKYFLLLGTMHIISLSQLEYPKDEVKKTIFNCGTLICERFDEHTPEFVEYQQEHISSSYHKLNLSDDWFEELSSREQKRLCDLLHNIDADALVNSRIDVRIISSLFETAHTTFGMDFYIQDEFIDKSKKIIGLDTTEENIKVYDFLLSEDKKEILKELQGYIQESIRYGGWLNSNKILTYAKHYLSGSIHLSSSSDIDYTDLKLKTENERWWNRLSTLLNDHSNPCVVVGVAHCIGKNAFLDFAFKDGWHVQKWDSQHAEFDVDLTYADILVNFDPNMG